MPYRYPHTTRPSLPVQHTPPRPPRLGPLLHSGGAKGSLRCFVISVSFYPLDQARLLLRGHPAGIASSTIPKFDHMISNLFNMLVLYSNTLNIVRRRQSKFDMGNDTMYAHGRETSWRLHNKLKQQSH